MFLNKLDRSQIIILIATSLAFLGFLWLSYDFNTNMKDHPAKYKASISID